MVVLTVACLLLVSPLLAESSANLVWVSAPFADERGTDLYERAVGSLDAAEIPLPGAAVAGFRARSASRARGAAAQSPDAAPVAPELAVKWWLPEQVSPVLALLTLAEKRLLERPFQERPLVSGWARRRSARDATVGPLAQPSLRRPSRRVVERLRDGRLPRRRPVSAGRRRVVAWAG
jgi:hypothetical protein